MEGESGGESETEWEEVESKCVDDSSRLHTNRNVKMLYCVPIESISFSNLQKGSLVMVIIALQ